MVRPPYQTAVRLSAVAASNWPEIDGEYTGKGIDLLRLHSFSRFLSVIYVWALARQSQEDAEHWKLTLMMPVKGQKLNTDSPEDEMKQLQQFNLE
jgi:hypothetical protein